MKKRRSWSDDEKREICQQTMPPGVSVAQVARRYAMNANMIYTWLKDPRFAPLAGEPEDTVEDALFIEVAMPSPELPVAVDVTGPSPVDLLLANRVDIALSDGRRILVEGPTSLLAVVGLAFSSSSAFKKLRKLYIGTREVSGGRSQPPS